MTILQALAHRYDRLAMLGKMPIPGYGPAQISFTIVLREDGTVADIQDARSLIGKRYIPKKIDAPQAPSDRRGEKIVSGTFWDTADYALGVPRPEVTGSLAAQDKLNRKAVEKHQAFKEHHRKLLAATTDEGCIALSRFLDSWKPDQLGSLPHAQEVPGQNVAFKMQGEAGYIHNRKDAFACFSAHLLDRAGEAGICLVTGKEAPIARLHLPIKGVGDKLAPLVSFNEDAFESYRRLQGENAPVSEAAAFAYATALNGLLEPSGRDAKDRPVYTNRVVLGDTSTVFWAEHDPEERLMQAMLGTQNEVAEEEEESADEIAVNDVTETTELRTVLQRMQDGVPLRDLGADLHAETRAYVLGLSPNAARLSVRFWVEQSFADFTAHFQQHWRDLHIEPRPRFWPPPLWALLREIAPQRKSENISPVLSGEVMRAILTGHPYPRSLLAQTVMRIRSDQDEEDRRSGRILEKISDLRIALLKACLTRMYRWNQLAEDVPVSIDLTTTNPAYRLGRLFAVLERLQRAALGQRNATVRDRFYAAASATPSLVFPSLIRNARNHSKSVRVKVGAGLAEWFEDHIADIASGMDGSFPRTLPLEEQGRFALGYYHQRDVFRRKKDVPPELEAAEANVDTVAEGE